MVLNRLKEYIDSKGITVAAFERSVGMSNSSFGKSLKNGGAIGTDKLENILNVYRDLSPTWLLTGEGSMLRSEEVSEICDVEKEEEEKDGIPLLPLSAMAGAMTSERTVLEYECERYVVPAFKGADFIIPVKGDSMCPTYHSGDLIACKRVPMGDLFFQWNKAYVLDTKQGPLVKRIKPGQDALHVKIVSDNEMYDPFELPRSAINSVAMVMGIIRLE